MSYIEVRGAVATESIEGKTIRIEKHVQHGFKEDCLNLIEKFITEKEMNLKACRNTIMGIWGNPVGLAISEIGRNMLLLSFKDKNKGKKVLNGKSKVIGDMMRLILEVENPWRDTKLMRTFLRVKVALDVAEPLPTGFYLERDYLPNTWIHFKYEKLQDHYYLNCGRLGHGVKECKNQRVMARWDSNKLRFTKGLGVPQAKALENPERRRFMDG
ncbi:hypothetical protein AHAS_Ahas17G0136000 [Arachis hypogaea]|uniref:Zinc knuckle CX2CX4HX4C domain-containing protein n=1 Tax=Arachis hypogaea TaxID=3818 RepID=A0A444YB91_ARAHY|nr:hypothetical protein Ahy_B07g087054 [Arachis hypogaea]